MTWKEVIRKRDFRGSTGKETIDGTCKMRTPTGFCGEPTEKGKKYCLYCQNHIDNMNRLN